MRRPNPVTDFVVDADGVGRFVFARKTLLDGIAIECEFTRLTEGLEDVPAYLGMLAAAMSNLKVLTVSAPADWDLAKMDGEDEETYAKLIKVWGALRDKQESFRRKPGVDGEIGRPGDGGNDRVLVSPPVPPPADGSPVP